MTEATILKGVLHFHTETGTEGGHWSFYDGEFITPNTTRFTCKKCGLYWDKARETEADVLQKAQTSNIPGLAYCGEHDFQLVSKDNWCYEGLHILGNGDHLKIFSKEKTEGVIWEGEINLKQHELFTEHAGGLWIHSDQIGIDRDTWSSWFFEGLPAELTPN